MVTVAAPESVTLWESWVEFSKEGGRLETHLRGLSSCRKHSRRVASIASLFIISAVGCELFAPKGDCTAVPRYALQVVIADSISGTGVASGATVLARDGNYADSVQIPVGPNLDDLHPLLGLGRPGLYALSVRKAGYRDWTRSGIRVKSGNCGPERVTVAVLLQRATR